jgi:hypothetical protein
MFTCFGKIGTTLKVKVRVGKNPGFIKKTQPGGFFWVLLGFIGFFGFYWVLLVFLGFIGFFGFYWVLLGFLNFRPIKFFFYLYFAFLITL